MPCEKFRSTASPQPLATASAAARVNAVVALILGTA
jgi:hypothetical protein